MRIGIDARPLISESPSGIGIYLLEILRNFEKNILVKLGEKISLSDFPIHEGGI